MSIRKILFLLTATLSFLFYSCSDAPRNFNSSLLGPDQIDIHSVDSYTGAYPQRSSSFKTVIPTGSANTLMLGKYKNSFVDQEASILIQWSFYLPDSIKSDLENNNATIQDGWVELVKTYVFGDTTGTMDFSVHNITTPWTSIGFTSDSLNSANFKYDNADISTQRDVNADSIHTFHLSTSYLKTSILKSIDSLGDYGMYLKPTSGNKVIGYQSIVIGSLTQPAIKVVINKPGVYTDTLGFDAYADVSVLNGNLPKVPSTDIVMQSSLVGQSTIAFDVSSIPSDAIINKATLILTRDTLNSMAGDQYSPAITVYNVADSASTLIDSTFSSANITQYDSTYEGIVTGYVQKWITTKINQGLVLSPQDGLNGMEIFAFKGSNATEPWKRPRLVIIYTRKK